LGGEEVDINLIFRIAGVGILVSVLSAILKQAQRDELAQMLTLAGVVVVLMMVVQVISKLFADVRAVFQL
jgi:stage III sporulation protein AC